MSTLTIQLPGSQPVTHVLHEETITIGRTDGNTIVLDDASVSMFHARITKRDGGFFLKDLNSTNGTFVNGVAAPLTGMPLANYNEIRTGATTWKFIVIEPTAN